MKKFTFIMRKFTFLLLLIFVLQIVDAQNNSMSELDGLSVLKKDVTNKRVSSFDASGENEDWIKTGIEPGQKIVIANIPGTGIINHIWFTMDAGNVTVKRNDIIFRIYWDGNSYPSVESPIGPFFGQGWNEFYNYVSLPLAATPDNGKSLVSYFSMPFQKGAKIEIENQSEAKIVKFYYYIDYKAMKKLPSDAGRFHAWFNQELTLPSKQNYTDWQQDSYHYNYLFADIKGKGHFVGINYYVNNPTTSWYGEGDDMWFIDGQKKASLMGTGTEDFFNTSWGPKDIYTHPYFGYPRVNNEEGWLGRTHVYRFFITDPIYFNNGLRATIEHGHKNDMILELSTVAYWYQDKAYPLPAAPTILQRTLKPLITQKDRQDWKKIWNIPVK